MATRVTRQGWKQLLSIMEAKLPKSVEMYGLLKTSVSGDWPFYTFWVDQWPRVTSVVATPKYQLLDEFSGKFAIIHGQEVDVVTKMLQHPGVITWSRDWSFELPLSLLPALTDAVPPEKGDLSVSAKGTVFTITMDTLVKQKRPDGIFVGNLTKEHADYVAENSGFRSPGVKEFVERLISTSLPNVALQTSQDGKLLASFLTQPHNTIGMGFVHHQYRQQRFGSFAVNHLAEQLLMTSSIVAMTIEDRNKGLASIMTNGGWVAQHEFVNAQFRSSVLSSTSTRVGVETSPNES